MNVVLVSASDTGGGAHKVANSLHRGFRSRGHSTAMAVAVRQSDDPDVREFPVGISTRRRIAHGVVRRAIRPLARHVRPLRGPIKTLRLALRTAHPVGYLRARSAGREFFDFPGTRQLLDLVPFEPEIVHLHNLHTGYFDLRFLPTLSATVPVALTLHDEWTFTGHCAYSLVGDRWRNGCYSCPDLETHPAMRRDATHDNWLAKRAIYQQSRLYVTAPSRWLLERAQQSILAAGVADWRHIPNGVDRRYFSPGDRQAARDLLGLPRDPSILLFAANALNRNPFKDFATIESAVERIAREMRDRELLLVALGDDGPSRRVGNAELRFVPYESAPTRIAAYYRACDIYLHAANADTFPTTILEALAVGRPVVATAVGGIHEQIRSLAGAPGGWQGATVDPAAATGVLVPAHDPAAMSAAAAALLADDGLRDRLGQNAAMDAADRFDFDRQLVATAAWYRDVIDDWHGWKRSP